jgi:ketosteroid isomerase-like protein
VTESEVYEFFARYAEAVGSNELSAIAACYATPALIVSDDRTIAVPDRKGVEAAFAGAADTYSAHKLVGARALVESVDRVTERLAFVAVTWEYVDAQSGVQPGESYRYLVRFGEPQGICAVVPAG